MTEVHPKPMRNLSASYRLVEAERAIQRAMVWDSR